MRTADTKGWHPNGIRSAREQAFQPPDLLPQAPELRQQSGLGCLHLLLFSQPFSHGWPLATRVAVNGPRTDVHGTILARGVLKKLGRRSRDWQSRPCSPQLHFTGPIQIKSQNNRLPHGPPKSCRPMVPHQQRVAPGHSLYLLRDARALRPVKGQTLPVVVGDAVVEERGSLGDELQATLEAGHSLDCWRVAVDDCHDILARLVKRPVQHISRLIAGAAHKVLRLHPFPETVPWCDPEILATRGLAG
mmetsp:Transcript_83092/g.222032  ORF Transcript_83092/g.222032 Transcript_83092/m.222032 type:complete len:247 (+) Transcript_83092:249-989(+)